MGQVPVNVEQAPTLRLFHDMGLVSGVQIPLLGGAVVPLLAYASYRVHRAGYEAQIAGPAETP